MTVQDLMEDGDYNSLKDFTNEAKRVRKNSRFSINKKSKQIKKK